MKVVFVCIFFSSISYCSIGQNIDIQEENYKHIRTHHQEKRLNTHELEEGSVVLNNQRTHKKTSRSYILAPSDTTPETNVQGKKTKRNYKNQFN